MKLGNRTWNLPWKLQTQHRSPFILSWEHLGCDAVNRCQDVSVNFSQKSQGRGDIPSSCERLGKTDFRAWQIVYQAWHQPWILLKSGLCTWCLCQPHCREWAAASVASVHWAECLFGPGIAFPSTQTGPCPYRRRLTSATLLDCYQDTGFSQ